MELNADFRLRTLIHTTDLAWLDSPMVGVQRRMLDRIGAEVARATSIVRYAPGSAFSAHVHTGGEEFLVLDGVFQDEHGDFPAGSYIRNPPETRHTPGSEAGCMIFVKLWQFDPADRTPIMTNIEKVGAVQDASRAGVSIVPLYQDEREDVRVENWAANARVSLDVTGGAEVLVLDGSFTDGEDSLRRHSWLRIPIGGEFDARVGPKGAQVWVKTGGLQFVKSPGVSQ